MYWYGRRIVVMFVSYLYVPSVFRRRTKGLGLLPAVLVPLPLYGTGFRIQLLAVWAGIFHCWVICDKANVMFSADSCVFSKSLGFIVQVNIQVMSSSEVLFYPTFSLFLPTDQPLFPLFDDDETNVVLLPGSNYIRTLESPTSSIAGARITTKDVRLDGDIQIRVRMTSWNSPTITHYVACAFSPENFTELI
mmetsp:Transcript_34734/g.37559  ORF Transcript_34734/g.37559 Transcript_34734/m.37559 type:complete len:192 (-) Transcript_34734:719-1294(-)